METRGFPDGFQLNAPPLTDEEIAKVIAEFARLQQRARDRGELPQSEQSS